MGGNAATSFFCRATSSSAPGNRPHRLTSRHAALTSRILDTVGEPDTPDGNAALRPGLHDFRARLAGHIGVVDNDSPHAGGEGGVERRHEIAQTAAGIITIQARISTGGKGLSKRRLAGARQPHDEDHVGVLSERRRRTAWRAEAQQSAEGKRSSRACRSSSLNSIRCERLTDRAVSTRVTPGKGTTTGARSRSQARAISNGVALWAAATFFSTGSVAVRDLERRPRADGEREVSIHG